MVVVGANVGWWVWMLGGGCECRLVGGTELWLGPHNRLMFFPHVLMIPIILFICDWSFIWWCRNFARKPDRLFDIVVVMLLIYLQIRGVLLVSCAGGFWQASGYFLFWVSNSLLVTMKPVSVLSVLLTPKCRWVWGLLWEGWGDRKWFCMNKPGLCK